MRISTGLRPRTELQRLPERETAIRAFREEFTATIPVPHLRTRDVWVLQFQKVTYFSDGEHIEGDVLETMLSGTEPKIEKRSFKFVMTDEYPQKKEAEDRYRWDNHIPEDANRRSTHNNRAMYTDVELMWYEVTL